MLNFLKTSFQFAAMATCPTMGLHKRLGAECVFTGLSSELAHVIFTHIQ